MEGAPLAGVLAVDCGCEAGVSAGEGRLAGLEGANVGVGIALGTAAGAGAGAAVGSGGEDEVVAALRSTSSTSTPSLQPALELESTLPLLQLLFDASDACDANGSASSLDDCTSAGAGAVLTLPLARLPLLSRPLRGAADESAAAADADSGTDASDEGSSAASMTEGSTCDTFICCCCMSA